ncbi:hypothetical protein CB0940_07042 [Cercospora beticola]|uniref:Uncharacterized protein n=1 Tax=Cercospora beticola TaxID=122368 RepID=A0A2G5H9J5_CERBT|nr:hypothetical protein CB0940_07042 [Cercospora beticola]PIA89200.1 hypothetical protein CB0940_07042 [Cercospora beticola]WPB02966.1 hypothetical protein RHO25_007602 [Cercospora beticola]CAK1358334.1 unnamed protein product [Cercospora beticola]
MPRKLPWLKDNASEKDAPQEATKTKARPRTASPNELVGPDLEDLQDEPARPARPEKQKQIVREPSSSPPPAPKGPPPVEYMKPGYDADDIWMMVEDEFYSTAQLYTEHLHQAEYARLKKLRRSRGQETLATLARATDGRTPQSTELQVKRQQEENQRKRRQAVMADSDSEDEDEFMKVPQLANLMTGSQGGTGPAQTRSTDSRSRRALAEDGDESSDPLPKAVLSPLREMEDEDEETESDDLDAPLRKKKVPTQSTIQRSAASSSGVSTSSLPAPPPKAAPSRVFKQFGRARREEQDYVKEESEPPSLPSSPPPRLPAPLRKQRDENNVAGDASRSNGRQAQSRFSSIKQEPPTSPINDDFGTASVKIKEEPGSRPLTSLAKRRAQKAKEEAEAKRKELEASIPTFLF